MADELQSLDLGRKRLSAELASLLSAGFIRRSGCVFLASLAELHTNASQESFPDKTGYECFVNSIHIDDYVEGEYLADACLFLEALFERWRRSRIEGVIEAIVSSDEFGAVVKFHVIREGESWVSKDMEKYDDAILSADSSLPLAWK